MATAISTPCIEWQKCRNKSGYGIVGGRERRRSCGILAHRHAWADVHGPIPEGMCVLHRCDNPPCVNPDHLFLGTQADNMRDMRLKSRAKAGPGHGKRGEEVPVAKLTNEQARQILLDSRPQRQIARDFGIVQQTVSDIKRGRRWAWLQE